MTPYVLLFIGWLLAEPIIVIGGDAQCLERGYVRVAASYKPYCIERVAP